jgi:hypothetical protein
VKEAFSPFTEHRKDIAIREVTVSTLKFSKAFQVVNLVKAKVSCNTVGQPCRKSSIIQVSKFTHNRTLKLGTGFCREV